MSPRSLPLFLLAVLWSAPALAYDFEITARTEGYGYQLRRYERDGVSFLNRRRITQYLGLRVFNLLEDGSASYSRRRPGRPPAVLTFHAQLRFETEFGAYADAAPAVQEVENNQLDLLFGGLEGRNLWGWVDFSLGRQLDTELQDFFAYDGLRVRVGSPWHLYAEAYFGTQVAGAHPFSSTIFETDGASGERSRSAWSPSFGAAIGTDDLGWLNARVAYRGVASRSPMTEADATGIEGAPIWGIDQEALFFGVGLDLPVRSLRLRPQVGIRYNLLLASLDELQASAGVRIGDRIEAQVELLRARPHFDGDSIFNLFAVEPYSELSSRGSLLLAPRGVGLTVSARAGYRWLWDDGGEPGLGDESGATVLGVGLDLHTSRLRAGLEGYHLNGRQGATFGGDLDGSFALRRWLSFEGRLSIVRLHDSTRPDATLTAFGVQAGATLKLVTGLRLHLLLEDNVSRLYASAFRLLGVVDLELAP
jgi:hypothetical protein